MVNPFQIGATKTYCRSVGEDDTARFDSGEVHAVYSTFALARDAEWCGRLFVLDMKESDEEGIGTGIQIEHISPALLHQEVVFTATLIALNQSEVITEFTARVGERVVAYGQQKQKILKKVKIEKILLLAGS